MAGLGSAFVALPSGFIATGISPSILRASDVGTRVIAPKSTTTASAHATEPRIGGALQFVFGATCVVGASTRRARRDRASVVRCAEPQEGKFSTFVSQLRNRLSKKRVVLEQELLDVQKAAADAEKRAAALQQELETDLEQEKSVNEQLKDELMKVKKTYTELNDQMETMQTENEFKESAFKKDIANAMEELEDAKKRESKLEQQIGELEEKERQAADEQKSLLLKLDEAQKLEDKLESQLARKEATAAEVAERLAAEQEANREFKEKLADGEIREKEYRRWIGYVEEENQKLKQRLDDVVELERREEELSARLNEQHERNKQLDKELKAAKAKLAKPRKPRK